MFRKNVCDRCYIIDEKLNGIPNICHCFTTARGGASFGKINGLNLGFRVGDNPKSVEQNYKTVADDLNMTFSNMVLSRQTHTDNIRIVTELDRGKGLTRDSDITDTDGLITNVRNTPLVVFSADCIPILLADKGGKCIGAVHAGWRGTVMEIPGKAVKLMWETFGVMPKNIVAAIGPGIGPCCFEVGEEVAGEFDDAFVKIGENGKFFVDLWSANFASLKKAGVLEENISVAGMCTKCGGDEFYSYRRMKDKTGRLGAIIELR